MEFSSGVYGAIAFSFLFYYLFWSRFSKSKPPPHAGGARLITGHLHLLRGGPSDGLPHVNLATLADKYGPALTIQLGVRRVLVVSSSELVKELFTTNDVAVSSHQPTKAAKHLGLDTAALGYESHDSYLHELRKLVLSSHMIELQRQVRLSEIAQFMKELYKAWEKRKDVSGRVRMDMKRSIEDFDLNVVMRTMAGKRLCGGEDAAEKRWRRVMRDFFHLAGVVVVGDAFPHFGWLDVGGYEKLMKETSTEMGKALDGWLAEHRRKEFSGEDMPQDFMDMMLLAVQDGKLQGQPDVDTIIKATCKSLIADGSDTTTIMLVRTLSLLLNNSHVLIKAQEELDKHIGKERGVIESDIDNLVYLQAIVKEALRLYPPAPLGGAPREFTKSRNVGGYHVSKGTWLIVNLWKLQRDPQVWEEDPYEFRPERFLGTHTNLGQDYELIPFGAGRRVCSQTLHLVLANMLQAFEFSTLSDEQINVCEVDGVMNSKDMPLDVLVAPRLSPHLY